MPMPRGLLVTADDRSGAMESAAQCADAGWRSVVTSWDGEHPDITDVDCEVIDLRSRHVSPESARERVTASLAIPAVRRAHKIDSTLRGNWAVEIDALRPAGRILVVPAYPSAGRTCVGGIVRVAGVPVADSEFGADPRSPARTSRPAAVLGACEAADLDALRVWLSDDGPGACVADAVTDGEVEAIVRAVRASHGVVIVGTGLTIGAVARSAGRASSELPTGLGLGGGGVLVVCGSRSPVSVRQAEAVASRPGVSVMLPPPGLHADPEVVALELAVRAHEFLAASGTATVVLLGGDTADAFVGERVVRVLGSLGGMALGVIGVGGRRISILSKPGGFGNDHTVLDLLNDERWR